ncbi:hypothetical protein ACUOA8_02765 [Escherichia sp. SS-MK2]
MQLVNKCPRFPRRAITLLHCVSFRIKGFRGSGMRRVEDDHARQLQSMKNCTVNMGLWCDGVKSRK